MIMNKGKLNKSKLNKNNIKYLAIGLTLGLSVTTSLSFADDIKEYICSKVGYKIMINGSEFKSDKVILNYNGNTYLPLKAIGESLGVLVEWDDKLKQVEINSVDKNVKSEAIVTIVPSPKTITSPIVTKEEVNKPKTVHAEVYLNWQ